MVDIQARVDNRADTDNALHNIVGARQDIGLQVDGFDVVNTDFFQLFLYIGSISGSTGNSTVELNLEARADGGAWEVVDSQVVPVGNDTTDMETLLFYDIGAAGVLDVKITASLLNGSIVVDNTIAEAEIRGFLYRIITIPSGTARKIEDLPDLVDPDGSEISLVSVAGSAHKLSSKSQNDSSRGAGGFGFSWDGVSVRPSLPVGTSFVDVVGTGGTNPVYEDESPGPRQLTQDLVLGELTLNGTPGAPVTSWAIFCGINADAGANRVFELAVLVDTGGGYVQEQILTTKRDSGNDNLVQAYWAGRIAVPPGTKVKLAMRIDSGSTTVNFNAVQLQATAG